MDAIESLDCGSNANQPELQIKKFGRPKKSLTRRDPLAPYERCRCGACFTCMDNDKWDRIFAKFAVSEYGDEKGMFRSPLSDI